jgi:DNA-binding transcriptional ArsR family regulator
VTSGPDLLPDRPSVPAPAAGLRLTAKGNYYPGFLVPPPREADATFVDEVGTGTPLAGLVGRSRAALLVLLELPRSTTQLAQTLGVTAATVSEHLAVLKRSNLVRSRREGRSVRYERTTLGSRLLTDHG